MNPWSLRTALLARHAQHVVLIHFPIALFLTGVLFDLAASLMPGSKGEGSLAPKEDLRIPTMVDTQPGFGTSTIVDSGTSRASSAETLAEVRTSSLVEARSADAKAGQAQVKSGKAAAAGSVFFGSWLSAEDFATVSYWNLTLAAASAIPAAITGLLAWQWELEGRSLKGILLLHLLSGTASLLLIGSVWLVHERARRRQTQPSKFRWPLEILAVAVVAFTGHLGGFLSGVNHP